jgi:hypothetical protein
MLLTLLGIVGLALVLAATVDAIWTTLSLNDAGPITGRLSGKLWLGARWMHSRRPAHGMLTAAGTLIVLATLVAWLLMMWTGWTLIFASDEGAIVDLQTREPVDFVGRIYFAGYSITTLGTGDVVPVGIWRVATILCAFSGLVMITLAITYFGPILQAVTAGRRLATFIASMGRSPQEIILKAWHEGSLQGIESFLANLAEMINSHTHRHHAYPIVHYFHSADPASAVPLRLAVLDEMLTLVHHGLKPEARPEPLALYVLESAMSAYLHVLGNVYISPAVEPPPPPDLGMLRAAGLPAVSDEEFAAEVGRLADRRRLLKGLVEHDGWNWADVPLDSEGTARPGRMEE